MAQNIVGFQRFTGLGNELPQTGQTLSSGLSITVSLHLGHLTLWSLTRLISSGSKVLSIQLFLFEKTELFPKLLAWRVDNVRTKTLRDWIVTVAVPAKELFFTWRPGEVFVSARALRWVIDKGCLFLLACHCLAISQRILSLYFSCRFFPDSRVQNGRDKWQEKKAAENGAMLTTARGH